jgi:hypothetical protein
MKHMNAQPPQRPRVSICHSNRKDVWSPYPLGEDPVPGHYSCVFDRWCDICCIAISITRSFYSAEDRRPPSETSSVVSDIYQQLQGWYANLPDCLRAETTTVPHVLSLQYVFSGCLSIPLLTSQPLLPHYRHSALLGLPIVQYARSGSESVRLS